MAFYDFRFAQVIGSIPVKAILSVASLVLAYAVGLATAAKLQVQLGDRALLRNPTRRCWVERQVNFIAWFMVVFVVVSMGDVVGCGCFFFWSVFEG